MKPRLPAPTPTLVLALALAFPATLPLATRAASDWPSWRGPEGHGGTPSPGLPGPWSAADLAWKLPLPGKGTSTPILLDENLILTSPLDGEDAVLAVSPAGRLLWQTRLGTHVTPKHRSLASGCNASPVTDGRTIFVHFKSGNLAALNPDGSLRWKTNLVEGFGQERLFWDSGSSPVVTDQHVVIARLHQGESWLAGFDKSTGRLAWRQARQFTAPTENDNGYATPVRFQHRGEPALLLWGADRLTAHRAADGQLLWTAAGFNPEGTGYWPAIATPVVAGDLVVVPVGRDDRPGQARTQAVRLGGSGDVTATHQAWKRDDVGVFVASPAVHDGRLYLLRHRGEVACLDPATGRTQWTGSFPQSSSPYYASPIVARDILHAAREDGTVFSARVRPSFEILSENRLGERIIATPVAAAGRLYFRGDAHLFCVAGK